MTARRFTALQRTIATLLLLTGLASQVRIVFACDLMDGERSSVCCCGEGMADGCAMGGGCAPDGAGHQTPDCCDLSVEPFSDLSVGGSSSSLDLLVLQNAPQPPPFVLSGPDSRFLPPCSRHSVSTCLKEAPPLFRSDIYLTTKRLRI